MRKPRKYLSLLRDALLHWMMGTALGILCAGLLLVTHTLTANDGLDWPSSALARFQFLLCFGVSFGVGATAMGVLFALYERA